MISTGKKLIKKFMAILLLLATTMSYFPMAVLAEGETSNEETQYLNFTAAWSEGGTAITTQDNYTRNIQFNLTLSGGPVFNNLSIYAEDITTDTSLPTPSIKFGNMDNATVSGGGKNLIYNSSMNSGYTAQGNVSFSFPRTADFSEYDKTIQLTLVGEYKLNGKTTQINEVRTFTAHVIPQPVTTQFNSEMSDEIGFKNQSFSRYDSPRSWALRSFTMATNIVVDSSNETYSKIRLEIDRSVGGGQDISKDVINSATNLIINVKRADGYRYQTIREADGTTYVEFTRGTQTDTFDENTRKYGYALIQVEYTYNVVEDTSEGTRKHKGINTCSWRC